MSSVLREAILIEKMEDKHILQISHLPLDVEAEDLTSKLRVFGDCDVRIAYEDSETLAWVSITINQNIGIKKLCAILSKGGWANVDHKIGVKLVKNIPDIETKNCRNNQENAQQCKIQDLHEVKTETSPVKQNVWQKGISQIRFDPSDPSHEKYEAKIQSSITSHIVKTDLKSLFSSQNKDVYFSSGDALPKQNKISFTPSNEDSNIEIKKPKAGFFFTVDDVRLKALWGAFNMPQSSSSTSAKIHKFKRKRKK